jgi:hypothetical protein
MVISCIHEEDLESIAEVVLSGCRTVFTYIYIYIYTLHQELA